MWIPCAAKKWRRNERLVRRVKPVIRHFLTAAIFGVFLFASREYVSLISHTQQNGNKISASIMTNTASAAEAVAKCVRVPGSTLVLSSAVIYRGKLYCGDSSRQAKSIPSEVQLRTPWTIGYGNIPALQIVTGANTTADLQGKNCSLVPGWSAMLGTAYTRNEGVQIGHYVYNTAAPYFDALATAFSSGGMKDSWQGYQFRKSELPPSGITVFWYPDSKASLYMNADPRVPLKVLPVIDAVLAAFATKSILSASALLQRSHETPFCFQNILAGLSGAQLDHYNTAANVSWPGGWHAFKEFIADAFNAKSVPRCRRNATNVVVLQRKGPRVLVNADEIAEAAGKVFSDVGVANVKTVMFEAMTFAEQLQLMAITDVLIGVDGTGLFNGNFMPEGSTVIRIKPYMLDRLVPGKSSNFKVIWQALGIRNLEWGSTNISTARPSVSMKELQDAIDQADELPYLTKFSIALSQGTYVTLEDFYPTLEQAAKSASAESQCQSAS